MSRNNGALLRNINRGEFAIAGFRNRDLRMLLDWLSPDQPGRRETPARDAAIATTTAPTD